jgi:hypothetical protein
MASSDPRDRPGKASGYRALAPRDMTFHDEGESFFTPPDGVDGLFVTHILELPYSLRIGGPFRFLLGEEPTAESAAVSPQVRAKLFEVDGEQLSAFEDRLISTRLAFLEEYVRLQMPLQAADLTFAQWEKPLMSAKAWRKRQKVLKAALKKGIHGPVTVVAATRLVPLGAWSAVPGEQQAKLDEELDVCLDLLNDFLLSLGLISLDPQTRPIARGDLPVLAPVIIEAFPMFGGHRAGASFLREIHNQLPPFARQQALDERVVEAAASLTISHRRGEEPFFLFFELMHRAHTDLEEHRAAGAIIASGTAVELLVSTVIREASVLTGEDLERREAVLNASFAARFKDHLGRYIRTKVDINDPDDPFGAWWKTAYRLRNEVVHRGHKPTLDEAETALVQTGELTVHVRDALLAHPDTESLGVLLPFGRREERREWDEAVGLVDGGLS